MTPSSPDPDDPQTYEALLTFIENNTGGPTHEDPPGLRPMTVRDTLVRTSKRLSNEEAEKLFNTAVENDDLFVWQDHEGHLRAARATDDALHDLIQTEQERPNPKTDVIEKARAMRDSLKST